MLKFILPLYIATASVGFAQNMSQYSDLAASKCVRVSVDRSIGGSTWRCVGVADYNIRVIARDSRETVTVVEPNQKIHDLHLWSVVSGGFSSVGEKAEWRLQHVNGKLKPVALIIRFFAVENPDEPEKSTSYLTVSKITDAGICVVAKVPPSKNQNLQAQKLADESVNMPCLR